MRGSLPEIVALYTWSNPHYLRRHRSAAVPLAIEEEKEQTQE